MSIDIECACGKSIEYDKSETLYNEDYTPHKITCSCCGAVYNLIIRMDIVYEGDPDKFWSDDDPEEQ
jgi:hypothetical protein